MAGLLSEFCSWLKENGLVGLYDGCIAFPVHDRAGNVVAAHYRLKDGSWRYYPQGAKVRAACHRRTDCLAIPFTFSRVSGMHSPLWTCPANGAASLSRGVQVTARLWPDLIPETLERLCMDAE